MSEPSLPKSSINLLDSTIDDLDYFKTVDLNKIKKSAKKDVKDFYIVEYIDDNYKFKKIYNTLDEYIRIENKTTILILSTFEYESETPYCLEKIKTQYQILSYQLDKYIKKQGNNEYKIYHQTLPRRGRQRSDELSERYANFKTIDVDFIFVCDNRGLSNRPASFAEKLKQHAKAVYTFSANNAIVGPEDVLFYMVPGGKRNKRHCKYLGWTCDSTLCKPMHLQNKLRVLIDHNYYGRHKNMVSSDLTNNITTQVCEFAKKYKEKRVIIKRFTDGGIETIDKNKPSEPQKYTQNNGLSYTEACVEYSRTDIFIVTHKECMGLSVLESAMSGAIVLVPKGYIKEELLRGIHHVVFEDTINWDEVLEKMNKKKSRRMVLEHDITNFVNKIITVMKRDEVLKESGYHFKNKHK